MKKGTLKNMITSIKIRTIAIIAAAAVLLAGIFGVVATVGARPSNGKTVVLDAGHGGIDGGVVGENTGIHESDINLAITKSLKEHLEKAGYNVVLTRKNSEGLYSSSAKNKKLSDLGKRKEIIEDAAPDLVVSIHQNYYPLSSVSGPQVFYAPQSESGKEQAATLQNMVNAGVGGKRVPMKGDFYILQCSPFPSLLIECGFLSNPDEEKLLVSAEYQQKMAYLIFSGIHSILGDGMSDYDLLYNS